jgi:hypothetical protein
MDVKLWGRMSWVLMQHHIKLVISPDDFNTKIQWYTTDAKQKYLIRTITHCFSVMFLCLRPENARLYLYENIFE